MLTCLISYLGIYIHLFIHVLMKDQETSIKLLFNENYYKVVWKRLYVIMFLINENQPSRELIDVNTANQYIEYSFFFSKQVTYLQVNTSKY